MNKNKEIEIAILAVIAFILTIMAYELRPVQAVAAKPALQRWEYQEFALFPNRVDKFLSNLPTLGEMGWELSALTTVTTENEFGKLQVLEAILKRPAGFVPGDEAVEQRRKLRDMMK